MRSVTGAVLSLGAAGTRRTEQPHNGCFLPSNLASRDAAAHPGFCFAFFSP